MAIRLQILILTLCVMHLGFAIFPQVDIWVSGLFYDATTGFWIDEIWLLSALREGLYMLMLALPLFALVALPWTLIRGAIFDIPARAWGFVIGLFVLGPGLLTNALLKSYWGRARPAHLSEFGGDKSFTPPFEITDQCADNCSFVSGEGSGAVAFALSMFYIAQFVAVDRHANLFRAIGVFVGVTGCVLRILKGRHFLSDTLFAALFMMFIAYGLACLIKRFRPA